MIVQRREIRIDLMVLHFQFVISLVNKYILLARLIYPISGPRMKSPVPTFPKSCSLTLS